jgi:MSHA biogenesis protein MshN
VIKAEVIKAQVIKAEVIKAEVIKAEVIKAEVIKAEAEAKAPSYPAEESEVKMRETISLLFYDDQWTN